MMTSLKLALVLALAGGPRLATGYRVPDPPVRLAAARPRLPALTPRSHHPVCGLSDSSRSFVHWLFNKTGADESAAPGMATVDARATEIFDPDDFFQISDTPAAEANAEDSGAQRAAAPAMSSPPTESAAATAAAAAAAAAAADPNAAAAFEEAVFEAVPTTDPPGATEPLDAPEPSDISLGEPPSSDEIRADAPEPQSAEDRAQTKEGMRAAARARVAERLRLNNLAGAEPTERSRRKQEAAAAWGERHPASTDWLRRDMAEAKWRSRQRKWAELPVSDVADSSVGSDEDDDWRIGEFERMLSREQRWRRGIYRWWLRVWDEAGDDYLFEEDEESDMAGWPASQLDSGRRARQWPTDDPVVVTPPWDVPSAGPSAEAGVARRARRGMDARGESLRARRARREAAQAREAEAEAEAAADAEAEAVLEEEKALRAEASEVAEADDAQADPINADLDADLDAFDDELNGDALYDDDRYDDRYDDYDDDDLGYAPARRGYARGDRMSRGYARGYGGQQRAAEQTKAAAAALNLRLRRLHAQVADRVSEMEADAALLDEREDDLRERVRKTRLARARSWPADDDVIETAARGGAPAPEVERAMRRLSRQRVQLREQQAELWEALDLATDRLAEIERTGRALKAGGVRAVHGMINRREISRSLSVYIQRIL